MSENAGESQTPIVTGTTEDGRTIVVTPNGMAIEGEAVAEAPGAEGDGATEESGSVAEMVEEPAKVMRIGHMVRTLLDEVKAAPLDDASRGRLRDIHATAIEELTSGLSDELAAELSRLSQPFTADEVPSDAELRIAQAQLVGWLEGLFQGIQTALFAQQMAARAQLEQMRRALPGPQPEGPQPGRGSDGMYL